MQIDKYVVIGNPIAHSKSPFLHDCFAKQTRQEMEYTTLQAPLGGFYDVAGRFFAQGGKGCNVTVPFKEEAYLLADILTDRAKVAGAVNTLKKNEDGQLLGDNTDGAGLIQDLKRHNIVLENARILLLGAGGAARGVIQPLLAQRPAKLMIANRTLLKVENLVLEMKKHANTLGYELALLNDLLIPCGFDALDSLPPFDLVINSTSASLSGEHPNIPSIIINEHTVMYDMLYGPGITSSNQWALNQGAGRVIDGLGMLVGQAAESFNLWRGCKPEIDSVLSTMRSNLNTER